MTRNYLVLVAGLAGTTASVAPACATLMTTALQTQSTGVQLTELSTPLTFNSFDTSLGVLDYITITVSDALNTQITVTAVTATSGTAQTEMFVGLSDPGNYLTNTEITYDGSGNPLTGYLDTLTAKQGFSLTTAPFPASTTLPPSGTIVASQTVGPSQFGDPNLLLEFATGPTVTLDAYTSTTTDVSYRSGNATASQHTSANVTVSLDYTYTPANGGGGGGVPVPEPVSLALFGSGLLGLGLIKLRTGPSRAS